MRHVLLHASALVALQLAPAAARAQANDAPRASGEATADELFYQAVALRKQERYAEACALFRRSLGLKTSVPRLFNVGDCLDREGEAVRALETFERALELARHETDPLRRTERVQIAEQRIAAARRKVAEIVLRPTETLDLELHLNGEPVPSGSRRLRLEPGKYQLRASAPGRNELVYELVAAAGSTEELKIELSPAAPAQATPPSEHGASSSAPVLPWVLVGTGAALVSAGVVTGIIAANREGELADNCPRSWCPDEATSPGWAAKINDAKQMATVTNVLWAVGLVTAGVGTGLLIFGGEDDSQAHGELQAACFGDFCSVQLNGSF